MSQRTHVSRAGRRWTEAGVEGTSWRARPAAAVAVRAVALLLPLGASVLATVAISRIVPRPAGLGRAVVWWAGITVAATVVLAVVDRLARRLLPLAALLKLSLAFPDRTPSRVSIALRAGSTAVLERRLEAYAAGELDAQPAQAATTILSLAASLSAHDRRTRGHSERVRALAEVLAKELGIAGRDLEQLRWAALLHDIGKLRVAQRVLNKPGAPDASEWRQLRRHPVEGERLVEPLRQWLGPWADAVRDHHERWDGTGYPAGLAGEEISYAGRVVAVVDAFETITATRPYKRPLDPAAARAELARSAGSHFDPRVVRAFLGISLRRLRLIMGPLSWLGALPFLGAVPEASVRASLAGGQLAAGGVSAGVAATGVVALSVSGAVEPSSAATRPAVAAASEQAPGGAEDGSGGSGGNSTTAAAAQPSSGRGAPAPRPGAEPADGAALPAAPVGGIEAPIDGLPTAAPGAGGADVPDAPGTAPGPTVARAPTSPPTIVLSVTETVQPPQPPAAVPPPPDVPEGNEGER